MENEYMSRRKFIGSTLIGLVACSQAQAFFKGSIIDRLFISGPREREAYRKITEYAVDGELTAYEKSQILELADNKKIRDKINSTDRDLKAAAEKRRKEAEAREREAKRREDERKRGIAESYYQNAVRTCGEGIYGAALYSIDRAIETYPCVKYSAYKSYIELKQDLHKGGREFKRDMKEASSWLGDKLERLRYRLKR